MWNVTETRGATLKVTGCSGQKRADIGSGPFVNAPVDQTHKRSVTTRPITIQPPRLSAINGVLRGGSIMTEMPQSG